MKKLIKIILIVSLSFWGLRNVYADNTLRDLKNDEYIKDYKIMSTSYDKTGVNLRIFFTVVENITDYQNIY